jgi:hypothetical protein
VREVVPGDGDKCGSTYLNRIYARFLQENYGDLDSFDEDTLEEAVKEFEISIKRKVTGKETTIIVRLANVKDNVE